MYHSDVSDCTVTQNSFVLIFKMKHLKKLHMNLIINKNNFTMDFILTEA